jgi:RNA polymerase sigma-70 factor, ECF subfamily
MTETICMRRETAGRETAGRDIAVSDEFVRQTAPFRRELLAHCYRMLGSVHDAEDLVQETMLRAWRSYPDFDPERASMRTWLHRIATNACLNALESRSRRPLPSDLSGASGLAEAPRHPEGRDPEIPWLQPFPDALLGLGGGSEAGGMDAGGAADPAAVVAARDSIRLAFVAALQHLPARQRAVLILRDVLAWRAAEVADLLEITTAAVNSALQRARAQLQEVAPDRDRAARPADQRQRELADRYVAAFVHADVDTLTRLLADEVVLEMPPFLSWFRGRETVSAFLAGRALAAPDRWRAIPVRANGQPAMGAYLRRDDGRHHAHSVQVFDVTDEGLAWIAAFQDPPLFGTFGLPLVFPD